MCMAEEENFRVRAGFEFWQGILKAKIDRELPGRNEKLVSGCAVGTACT